MAASYSIIDIADFPGYRVDGAGEVWTCLVIGVRVTKGQDRPRGQAWRRLKPSRQKSGHLMVTLYRDGKKHYRQVHQLVLEAFVGPCPAGMECCHGPGGHGDNSLGNLRWDTRSANAIDRNQFGRAVTREQHGMAKLTWADIKAIRAVPRGPGVVSNLSRTYGIGRTQVYRILKGEQWQEEDA